jgi:hypothetical protein
MSFTGFIQSAVAFGGYTFPYGVYISARQSDQRVDEVDIPYTAGSQAPQGVAKSVVISLTGQIGGDGAVDSEGNYITTRDQLEAEVQLMRSWIESGYQELTLGFADGRYCMAQKQKLKVTYAATENGRIAHVDIDLLVQDPRFLSAATHTEDLTAGTAATIANAGTALSYPKFTLTATAAATNPTFQVSPAGGSGYVQIALTVNLNDGDVLVIDCDPRNRANAVLLNGVPSLSLLGTNGCTNTNGDQNFFPYLQPGNNSALVTLATGSATIVASWQDAFAA